MLRPQQVGRQLGALEQRERLAEERDRRRDARDQVAADAEPEEHLGAVDVGERRALDERARLRSSSSSAGCGPRRSCIRAHASPESRRTCSSTAPVATTGPSACAYSSIAPRRSRASRRAPRPARAPPRRARARRSRRRSRGRPRRPRAAPRATRPSRRSAASCRARSARCTPSRTARAASSDWVSPAATRSWRSRSPEPRVRAIAGMHVGGLGRHQSAQSAARPRLRNPP